MPQNMLALASDWHPLKPKVLWLLELSLPWAQYIEILIPVDRVLTSFTATLARLGD